MLDQNSVTVSTWGEWKAAHPDTTIVAEDGGIGRTYDDDPLGGRDDDGPIFPIGDVDPRLDVQAPVLGVLLDDGTHDRLLGRRTRAATADGGEVRFEGVTVTADGGGFFAEADGDEVGTHEASGSPGASSTPTPCSGPTTRTEALANRRRSRRRAG